MKRICWVLVLLLTFTMLAAPGSVPRALASSSVTDGDCGLLTDEDLSLASDSDVEPPDGKGDPGGLGDGLGADENSPLVDFSDEMAEQLKDLDWYVALLMYLLDLAY